MRISETREGAVLEVIVKPRSKVFRIVVEGDGIIVHCTEEPVRGKANRELIHEMSRVFHKEVAIVSGVTSKQKLVLIKDTNKSEVERVLCFSQTGSTF